VWPRRIAALNSAALMTSATPACLVRLKPDPTIGGAQSRRRCVQSPGHCTDPL
jgi:hypothetical protein